MMTKAVKTGNCPAETKAGNDNLVYAPAKTWLVYLDIIEPDGYHHNTLASLSNTMPKSNSSQYDCAALSTEAAVIRAAKAYIKRTMPSLKVEKYIAQLIGEGPDRLRLEGDCRCWLVQIVVARGTDITKHPFTCPCGLEMDTD